MSREELLKSDDDDDFILWRRGVGNLFDGIWSLVVESNGREEHSVQVQGAGLDLLEF